MSDEEIRFKRSQGGHDANDLHNHGGQDARDEDKTERENLEDEIEALDEAEKVEVKTSKKIDIFDDDVEVPVDPADIEPEVDPEDPIEEKKIAEAKKIEEAEAEEAVEEAIEEEKAAEAPEEEPIMKIDSVEEPKAKTGAGWKVATILFALLAIAGCGAAAYLFLFDGTTKFLGREVSSKVEGAQAPTAPEAPSTPDATPIATQTAGRYIYLDGYDLAIKIPDNLVSVSYNYSQYNMGDAKSSTYEGNFSTLTIIASTNRADVQSAPEFIENQQPDKVWLGSLTIGRVNPEFADNNVLGEPLMKTDDGRSIWYDGPQSAISENKEAQKWEAETVQAIKNWLTNKDNYVKIK